MKILYYDCFSGISGDMNLGALVDLGVDPDYLTRELSKLSISEEFELKFSSGQKHAITGTKAHVILKEKDESHRHLSDIDKIIDESPLSDYVKKTSKKIFRIIAEAEGKIHGKPAESVHFHEVGAIDSIVDIIGAALCFDYLKPDLVMASSVELGGGLVKCAHGTMPVPAPATMEILRGIPVKTGLVDSETTTPTGAAILAFAVDEFKDKFSLSVSKIGYGLGTKDFDIPNILRVYLAEGPDQEESQLMIEANIDDMNPEFYSFVEDKLFEAGALDVFKVPIMMKKSRPGIKLSVLCKRKSEKEIEDIFFLHTTTLGVRKYPVEKSMLERKTLTIKTPWGEVAIKQGLKNGHILKQKPEYDQCAKIAQENKLPLEEVYREIRSILEEM